MIQTPSQLTQNEGTRPNRQLCETAKIIQTDKFVGQEPQTGIMWIQGNAGSGIRSPANIIIGAKLPIADAVGPEGTSKKNRRSRSIGNNF